ncbi:hypothetical protein UACE39S_03786 [Ureibacillus acetophenoni]
MMRVLANLLLRLLFYRLPNITINKDEEELFNHLFNTAIKKPDKLIEYNLSIPKYKFFHYLSNAKPVIFHGSNHLSIDSFEPREQTLYNGKLANAIFATKDPIWPVFFAILDKKKIVGNFRNGSLTANGQKSYHFYSLTKQTKSNEPWTSGMVYILPEESFSYLGKGAIQFNEWISNEPVSPLAKIAVKPDDFYFLHKVATHQSNESIIKSWLLYKFRTKTKKQ